MCVYINAYRGSLSHVTPYKPHELLSSLETTCGGTAAKGRYFASCAGRRSRFMALLFGLNMLAGALHLPWPTSPLPSPTWSRAQVLDLLFLAFYVG